jgi:hypothetical protein
VDEDEAWYSWLECDRPMVRNDTAEQTVPAEAAEAEPAGEPDDEA